MFTIDSKILVVSGSRSIRVLPAQAKESLDRAMSNGLYIFVGDAPGVDTLVQEYLRSKEYQDVTVWYSEKGLRTCLFPDNKREVRGSYSDRDKAMFALGDYHLALWDGKSPGTKRNISRKMVHHKVILCQ